MRFEGRPSYANTLKFFSILRCGRSNTLQFAIKTWGDRIHPSCGVFKLFEVNDQTLQTNIGRRQSVSAYRAGVLISHLVLQPAAYVKPVALNLKRALEGLRIVSEFLHLGQTLAKL